MADVVIHLDNARRDLLASRLLQEAFERRGVRAHLSSQRTDTLLLRRRRPFAFISSRGDFPWLRDVAKCCTVYVMPSEGARLTNETMTAVFTGRSGSQARAGVGGLTEETFSYIRRVFLWGRQTESVLQDTGLFRPEQLMVTGNPRFDLYSALRTGAPPQRRKGFTLGAAFSVKTTSVFDGRPYYARWLYRLDETLMDRLNLLPPGRHWEDLVWRDFAVLRRLMKVLRLVIENTDWDVLLRVGVFEDPEDYRFLLDLAPGRIRIQPAQEQQADFLTQVDALLTCSSTVGMEALALDIPVIAMLFSIPVDRLADHIDSKTNGLDLLRSIYHAPESIEQAFQMLEQASRGELRASPNPAVAAQTLCDLYDWPLSEPAAERIADAVLADHAAADRKPSRECFRDHCRFKDRRLEAATRVLSFAEDAVLDVAGMLAVPKFWLADRATGAFVAHREMYQLKNAAVERQVVRYRAMTGRDAPDGTRERL